MIYVSAKRVFLDTETSKIEKFQGTDFETALELYRAILLLSEYGESTAIQDYDEGRCLDELEGLLNAQAQLIIIDDIDTLTSGDIDAGMEQLFLIAARCTSGSKLLYTLRKLPSFARKNSKEVPGFREADEFPEFLDLCADQFGVCLPTKSEAKEIYSESEARPLAIETIVGLRRITGDYAAAIERWKGDKSDALDYLFRKEYDALSDPRSKLLLSGLTIFETAQNQLTLQSILSCSSDQIQDAISEVREMFLRVVTDGETGSTKYSLRSATRAFLTSASKEQDRFHEIKARVENFVRQSLSTPPALLTLLDRARRNRDSGDAPIAWKLLSNGDLPKAATEHPKFKAELAITAASLIPPNLTDARKSFEDAYLFGNRHYEMYQCWLRMEKQADSGTTKGIEVCNKVLNASGFNLRTRASFRRQLAYLQVKRSVSLQLSSPEESAELRRASALNNALAYKEASTVEVQDTDSYRAQAADSINRLCSGCGKWIPYSEFGIFVEKMAVENVPLSPFSGEIMSSFKRLLRSGSDNERRNIESAIRRISGKIKSKNLGGFSNQLDRAWFVESLNDLI